MIRLHVMGDGPPEPYGFAAALRAIADDIAAGGWAGDSIVGEGDNRVFVAWSLTWDRIEKEDKQ